MLHKIGIDPGFGGFKAAGVRDGRVHVSTLPSVVGVGETDIGLLGMGLARQRRKKPLAVTFDDVTYLAGPNVHHYARPVERLDFLRLSEGAELRALLYAVLWRVLCTQNQEDARAEAALLIGLPVEVLKDRSEAHKALHALRTWLVGEHHFAVNEQPVSITVNQVKAMAQPVGDYFAWGLDNAGKWVRSKEDLKAPIAIADIGFNTLDLFAIENGQVTAEFTGGDTLGMRRAAELIVRIVRDRYDVRLSLHQADGLIREKRPIIYTPEGEMDVVDVVCQALDVTAAAVTAFMERHWGPARQFRYLLVVGGGPLALNAALLRQFPHATILDDAVTANARGLAKLAQSVFSD